MSGERDAIHRVAERPYDDAARELRRSSVRFVGLVLLLAGAVWLAGVLLDFEVNLWVLTAVPVVLAQSWWTALRLRTLERQFYGEGD